MKKTQPLRKSRLALDATTVRRLDEPSLIAAAGAAPMLSNNDTCSCRCKTTQSD
jgi:hypothetical protein